MKHLGIPCIVILTGLPLACGSRPRALLPEASEVAGWAKTGEARTFAADNLWQYIDGDAEKYIQAGVQKTLTANYRYEDKIEAVADVHVMGTPDGAQKIMESEPAVGSQAVQLGDAGRFYGISLTFRKGPYFVRLVAYQDAPQVGNALLELGRAIDSKLR